MPDRPLLDPHQQTTILVVAVWALALIAYDAWAVCTRGPSATVSWTLAVVSRRWPVVSLACFAVLGHVFLVRWAPNLLSWENAMALGPAILGIVIGATMAAQKPDRGERRGS